MPLVAFDVLAATAPHATRKPAAHADREGSTQFADMLDKPDTTDQGASNAQTSDQPKDQGAPAQAAASSKPAADSVEPAPGAAAKATTSPDVTTPEAQPIEAAVTETPATKQEIQDFLAAVAAATGMQIKPVTQTKADDKPTETKPDDQDDDAAAATAVIATTLSVDVKSADAAAVVVTAPADTAAAVATPDETAAKSTGSIVAAKVELATAPAVADDTAVIPGEAKDAKPQAAAKADTPAPTPNLAPDAPAPETAKQANPQPTNSQAQPATAQPQAAGPKPEAPAQAAKPASAQHDVRALDVASTKPADNVQPMLLMQNNTAAPAADPTALAQAPATNAPQAVALPVAGIAIEIAGKAMAGKKTFDIRLDPPELGKIHVRLDVDHKGEVTSIITADRQDTFDLLRRDAQALERALQDAGVKTSNNGLQFSLRDHSTGRHDQPAFTDSARVIVRDDNLDTEIIAPVYRSFSGNRAGVDIRV